MRHRLYGGVRGRCCNAPLYSIGLLTNSEGLPVATRVFKGNTSDSKTVNDQIDILKNQFSVKKVVLVGDRAMFSKERKEEMPDNYS
jgi:transposase